MRDVFVLYRSYHEAMADFTDAQYGKLMRALAEYALNGTEPDKLDKTSKMIFTLVKPQIDSASKSYEAGKAGGRPRKETTVSENEKGGFLENKKGGFSKTETMVSENEKPINDYTSTSINTSTSTSINTSKMPPAVSSRLEQFFSNAEILRNKPFTFDEKNRITQKLVILGKTEEDQLKVIDQAIDRGWKDLYPLKKSKGEVDMAEFEAYYARGEEDVSNGV